MFSYILCPREYLSFIVRIAALDTESFIKSFCLSLASTDSEPVYDQPNQYHTHYSDSDHEADRGSSVSPPPPHLAMGSRGHQAVARDEGIYSEVILPGTINGGGGDQLVKPSFVKARKNVYAGMYVFMYVCVQALRRSHMREWACRNS